jgi:hypothetical protein
MTPRQVSSKVANKQTKKTTDKSNTKGKETNEIIKHLKKKLLPERRTKYTEEGKKKKHTLQYASSERPSTQTPLRWRLNCPCPAI